MLNSYIDLLGPMNQRFAPEQQLLPDGQAATPFSRRHWSAATTPSSWDEQQHARQQYQGGFQDVWAAAEAQQAISPVRLDDATQMEYAGQQQVLSLLGGGATAAVTQQQAGSPSSAGSQSGVASLGLSITAPMPQSIGLQGVQWQLPVMSAHQQPPALQPLLQQSAMPRLPSSSGVGHASQQNGLHVQQQTPQQQQQQRQITTKHAIKAAFQVAHELVVEDPIFSFSNKRPALCLADTSSSHSGAAAAAGPQPARRARSCGSDAICWAALLRASTAPAVRGAAAGALGSNIVSTAAAPATAPEQQRSFVDAARVARPSQTVPNLQVWQQQRLQQQLLFQQAIGC